MEVQVLCRQPNFGISFGVLPNYVYGMSKILIKHCHKHGDTDFTLEGRGYYRCKKCRVEAVMRRRQTLKQKLVEAFGGKCLICLYKRCIANLSFHHRDPSKKDFGISSEGRTMSYEKMKSEADKCYLLCCRCHGEVHAGIIQNSVSATGNGKDLVALYSEFASIGERVFSYGAPVNYSGINENTVNEVSCCFSDEKTPKIEKLKQKYSNLRFETTTFNLHSRVAQW